jgi:hypothetical protein
LQVFGGHAARSAYPYTGIWSCGGANLSAVERVALRDQDLRAHQVDPVTIW